MGYFANLTAAFLGKQLTPAESRGLDAVKAFTTADEPKLADYPRAEYQATWETILSEIPGGWCATVRFFGYAGSEHIKEEHQKVATTLQKLKPLVNELIIDKMKTFKR